MVRARFPIWTVLIALSACISREFPTPPQTPAITIDPIVCMSPIDVVGTKAPNTSIWLGNQEVVPLDDKTTFHFQLAVAPGTQTLSFTAEDQKGAISEKVEVTTELRLNKPESPTINPIPEIVTNSHYALSGNKPENTLIRIGDKEPIGAPNARRDWTSPISLEPGMNEIEVYAFDGCRNSDPATVSVFHDPTGVGITITTVPPTVPVCTSTFRVEGTRPQNISIEVHKTAALDSLVLTIPRSLDTHWEAQLPLEPDAQNVFFFVGKAQTEAGTVTSAVRSFAISYDASPPLPPELSDLPTLTPDQNVALIGQKEANTGVILNDMMMIPVDGMSAGYLAPLYNIPVALQPGFNLFELRTRDHCNRSSDPVSTEIFSDTEAPRFVSLTRPEPDATLTGMAQIVGQTSDNYAVRDVTIYAQGEPHEAELARLTPDSEGRFSFDWNTVTWPNGQYDLFFIATDTVGNQSGPNSIHIRVTIQNLTQVSSAPETIAQAQDAASEDPTLAMLSDGTIAVAWDDNYGEPNSRYVILQFFDGNNLTPLGDALRISTPGYRASQVRMSAAYYRKLHLAWTEELADGSGSTQIMYRQFDGAALGPTYLVSNPFYGDASNPDVAANGNEFHVVWQQGHPGAQTLVHHRKRALNGWSSDHLVGAMFESSSTNPRVAVTGDLCAHVAWEQDEGTNRKIFYAEQVLVAQGGSAPAGAQGAQGWLYLDSSSISGGSSQQPKQGTNTKLDSEASSFSYALLSELEFYRFYDDYLLEGGGGGFVPPPPSEPTCTWMPTIEVALPSDFNKPDRLSLIAGNGLQGRIFLGARLESSIDGSRHLSFSELVAGNALGWTQLTNDPNITDVESIALTIDGQDHLHAAVSVFGDVQNTGADSDIFLLQNIDVLGASTPYLTISDGLSNVLNTESSSRPRLLSTGDGRFYIAWEDESRLDGDSIADRDIILTLF